MFSSNSARQAVINESRGLEFRVAGLVVRRELILLYRLLRAGNSKRKKTWRMSRPSRLARRLQAVIQSALVANRERV